MLDTYSEIKFFQSLTIAAQKYNNWDVDTSISSTVVIKLKGRQISSPLKQVDLTFAAVIHGNEVGGLAVCNRILEAVLEEPEKLQINLGFILGNPEASLENIRFKDRDLNRSFDRLENQTTEDRRARDLEKILKQTRFLLDFHQTREPSAFPFFISPYTQQSFLFAGAICDEIPMVTHWGKPFSGQGRCSDEFVNCNNGVGLTLELGKNGYDLRQILCGLWAGQKAIDVITKLPTGALDCAAKKPPKASRKIYTWAEAIGCPDPEGYMKPGYQNFSPVKKGEHLGTVLDSVTKKPQKIFANHDGFILFPKYLDPEKRNHHATVAMEFCRIVKEISENDLGV